MKESIRSLALSMGADVCGFADIDRFADAPGGFSPVDLFAQCRSVIIIGIALPKGLWKVNPRLIYQHFNELSTAQIDAIELRLAKEIESRFGGIAVPVPCDSPYEYWDAANREGRGLVSMKHAAVCAGLGTLGKNTMLLNRIYGNTLNLGAILTDLPLPSDPPVKSLCIEGCTKCVDSCPVGAIQNGTVVQKLCRAYTYGQKTARGYATTECNHCRTICPLAFGLSDKDL
ncbi:MAG TPA: epoxyqueuosine reductase [Candidatus Limiplasma sp.]|nr:epoxyqueuosine reductase [Candidatus Limiplasma sp.]